MTSKLSVFFLLIVFLMSCDSSTENKQSKISSDYTLDRTVLPIQPPAVAPITEMDAGNVTKPEAFEIKAPQGAPNVVVVLIDDIGFGATSTFGGAIKTPAFDQLAENGLRFNRFHTTALCSPPVLLYFQEEIITT